MFFPHRVKGKTRDYIPRRYSLVQTVVVVALLFKCEMETDVSALGTSVTDWPIVPAPDDR
jgi:hypothetical protein